MKTEDAKKLMADAYRKIGKVEDKGSSLVVTIGKMPLRVCAEDLEAYADQYDAFGELRNAPNECSICSPGYREQVIASSPGLRLQYVRSIPTALFGEKGPTLYAEIGPASVLFKNRLRFESHFLEVASLRAREGLWGSPVMNKIRRGSEGEPTDVRELIHEPTTIKIFNIQAPTIEQSILASASIVDACIFELSYLKGVPVEMQEEWSRRRPKSPPFRFPERMKGDNLPVPKVVYRPEILRFYQRGIGTQDPVIQFLSFYQVLEFFFVTVSDAHLYSKLARRLADPAFSLRPRSLDALIRDVLDHKRETDETEMLKLVLSKYVDFQLLADFIHAYETHAGEQIYTKRCVIFGEDIPDAKLQESHLHSNIATRIKVIRNAVVHSSDRHERQERYVPLTRASEDIIAKEIPLLRFLAERLIIASAADLVA